ncbi:MAG: cation:proton antiporter, partial [Bacteroidales bacterium]|nr:cation:proton antiporter [Bacteroidales bacterium]
MFALGLEFSIKKLKKVGATGAITALTELAIMFVLGNMVGHLLGWGGMDCIFLGCMLSISSTTIIIKSFDDLKLKQQKFTNTVTAVLVVEDLVAVLLLVILSTLSVSKSFNGGELGMSMVKLMFFLIVWFTFGIFLIPTFLRWMRRWMTEETLCIVAVGLCFGMVVLADFAGFSTALGAFVMGAILSETIEADVIHRIITPIKNLFGAVFFVSVGMLVNPGVLVRYFVPILVIAATVIVFKSSAATLGIVLSGKPLKTAMQGGFCFCQIGEFSFIIAGLGLSFGVIDANLYPIIVSVSILTTFVTPYMIKAGLPAYEKVYPKMPARMKRALEQYSTSSRVTTHEKKLSAFVKKQITAILLYGVILTALAFLSFLLLKPFIDGLFASWEIPAIWGDLLGMIITLLIMAPFLWALAVKNVSRERVRKMLQAYNHSQVAVIPLLALRYFLTLFFVGWVVSKYVHMAVGLLVVIAIVVVLIVLLTKRATDFYNRIEDHFVSNFNQRQAQHSFQIPESLEKNFLMERMTVTPYSPLAGLSLSDTQLRQEYHVNVVTVERAGKVYDLPEKDMMVMPTDRLTLLGNEDQLARVRTVIEVEPDMLIHDHSDHEINTYRLEVAGDNPLVGVSIRHSGFMTKYHAMVIGIERGSDYMVNPMADTVFNAGDIVWFVSPKELKIKEFQVLNNNS